MVPPLCLIVVCWLFVVGCGWLVVVVFVVCVGIVLLLVLLSSSLRLPLFVLLWSSMVLGVSFHSYLFFVVADVASFSFFGTLAFLLTQPCRNTSQPV